MTVSKPHSQVDLSIMYTTTNYSSRGRGRGRSSNVPTAVVLPSDRDMFEGLRSAPVTTLPKPAPDLTSKTITIKDQEPVASYNWVAASDDQPTIIVPGEWYL